MKKNVQREIDCSHVSSVEKKNCHGSREILSAAGHGDKVGSRARESKVGGYLDPAKLIKKFVELFFFY